MDFGTVSDGETAHYEHNQRVYPCRCGNIHDGDYAAEDYAHHNCFHDCELVKMPKVGDLPDKPWQAGVEQVDCPDCGKIWEIREASCPTSLGRRV